MASSHFFKSLAVLAIALVFCIQFQAAQGRGSIISCENLKKDVCAFAVSSTGQRCVLEKHVRRSGEEAYVCTSSEIEADKLKDWVETDECIQACGLDRNVLGISSDSLLESQFTQHLCSPQCYNACPNIVDLYFNLAAGEGVYLPTLCESQGESSRRGMAEMKSSGNVAAAAGPIAITPLNLVQAPAALPPFPF